MVEYYDAKLEVIIAQIIEIKRYERVKRDLEAKSMRKINMFSKPKCQ